ncbi:MAG: hypothetical protein CMP11_00350 [Zetaproteobacteria bacterium]|jgi:hypothetical protein|nr:hypothetical protein [Pseudobdellovibrionaceae bacterium]
MGDLFWFQNPSILFRKDRLTQLWPYESMSYHEKLNATTRFIILISFLGFMILNNYLILLFGIVLILLLLTVFHLNTKKNIQESMETMKTNTIMEQEKHTPKNPLYNVLLTDYETNPNKKAGSKKYDASKEELINSQVKNFVLENNKDNKDIGKIFKNMVNNIEFEKSMRQFHMNPSTTIPNDQDDFLKYCYNDLYSEKPLLIY